MKILHIDETFHPLYGYHTAPIAKAEARQGNQVYILTASWDMLYPVYRQFGDSETDKNNVDNMFEKESGVKVIRVKIKRYISNRAVYSHDVFRKIDEIHPDIIYVHLVESLIACQLLWRKKKYPMIFDSHMLSMASKNKFVKIYNRCYRTFVTPIIRKNKYPVVRTQEDSYVNTVLGIPDTLTPFISFGTDTDLFKPSVKAKTAFLNKHGLPENSFIIVYTGKINEDKGGMLLAKAAQSKFNTDKSIVFLIVGNTVGKYGEVVEAEFEESENRVIRYPLQKYIDLPKFYQCSDICVFPKQCSLSFYDAQACGLPVVFEDNNINVDRARYGNALTFEAGNVEDFREKIQHCIDMKQPEFEAMQQNALNLIKEKYDYFEIEKQYATIFEEESRRFQARKKRG